MLEAANRDLLRVTRLLPEHVQAIERQPSQRLLLGMEGGIDDEEADALAGQPEAWSCWQAERLVACVGIQETFPGRQGVAWAVLAPGLGARAHLALTRFVQDRILASPLARIEAIARCADAEAIVARFPGLDAGQLVAAVLAMPTPEVRWAQLVGLAPAHVLRKFGGRSETYMLCERVG